MLYLGAGSDISPLVHYKDTKLFIYNDIDYHISCKLIQDLRLLMKNQRSKHGQSSLRTTRSYYIYLKELQMIS